ncbi:helix-turn-helix transcriptional regulator [Wenjunlia tyrosinilytica]|uniref:histidine kinase n=1 Tax=Wenjunlia tyrosinilytica TaxID=1544741 RepID=A0A917ZWG2_9ACTN|nr:PAS domain-containing protein [Wenjunlia tyrosinilytica]GGO97830.1 hypothetical protein GCM10012280_60540 [Wenjunlia tyrosinilytica]
MKLPSLSELSRILHEVPVGIWGVDRDLRFQFAAGHAFEGLADREGPVSRVTVVDFLDLSPKGKPASCLAAALGGRASAFRLKRGEHWMLVHAAPWEGRGGIVGIVGAVIDIDAQVEAEKARHQAELKFRRFMDSAPAYAFMFDEQERLTYANQPYLDLYGKTASQVIGKTQHELHPPDVADQYVAADEQVRRGRRPMRIQAKATRFDGHTYYSDGYKFPFRSPDGRLLVGGIFVDTTARVRAERERQAAESRFALFMDFSPAISFLVDADDRTVWANKTYLDEIGRSAEDVVGKLPDEIHGPGTGEQFGPSTQEVLRTGSPVRTEQAVYFDDGTFRHLDGYKFPVPQPDGSCLVGGTFVDVTERVRAEQARRSAEERFSTFMRLLPAAAYTKDENLRFTWANTAALRNMGVELADLVGRTDIEIDDGPLGRTHHEQDASVLAARHPMAFHVRTNGRDMEDVGQSFGFRFPLPGDGNDAVGGVFLDTTEERRAREGLAESETRFRILFERSPIGIAVTDMGARIAEVNSAFADMLKTTSAELKGTCLPDLTYPREDPEESGQLRQLISGQRSQYRLDKQLARPGGDEPVSVTQLTTVVRDSSGTPQAMIAMVSLVHDVTQRTADSWKPEDIRLLKLVADGASDAQASRALGLGESTVRLRLSSLKRRLRATNRAHLVARAYQVGLLSVVDSRV